jgi:hypothetical protein
MLICSAGKPLWYVEPVEFLLDVFIATMRIVVDHLNFPSYGISGDGKRTTGLHSLHQRQKLFRFPWLDLRFTSFSIQRERPC